MTNNKPQLSTPILQPVMSHKFVVQFGKVLGITEEASNFISAQLTSVNIDFVNNEYVMHIQQPEHSEFMDVIKGLCFADCVKFRVLTFNAYTGEVDLKLYEDVIYVTDHSVSFDYAGAGAITHVIKAKPKYN